MKKSKIILIFCGAAMMSLFLISADHIDAPAVAGGSSDITDFYAFEAADSDNVVLVANVQGLLSPDETADAKFDPNLMIEFNIDTDGDLVEDLVISAVPKNKKMYFAGPIVPSQTGLISTFDAVPASSLSHVKVTKYGSSPTVKTSQSGMKFFAGPRDDPFFFDFAQYSNILAGGAPGFNNPGSDTFAGTNVLSIVVEVPKSLLGNTGTLNTWVESKRKQ